MFSDYFISAEEWQFLAFFEVEPTKLDAEVPWVYNRSTYRHWMGDVTVTFVVEPASKEFMLTVERRGVKEIDVSATSVFDIRCHDDIGAEWLEILLTEDEVLELRIRPSFSLSARLGPQRYRRGPQRYRRSRERYRREPER